MCDTCGCNITPANKHLLKESGKLARDDNGRSAISVLKNLLSENNQQAAHNRQHFDRHKVLAVNLMSSPGAGKTRLLEASIEALQSRFRIAVIVGDLETENDAERIRNKGVNAIQISTGSACHLDAHMIHEALHQLDLSKLDIVFIENVGNLVCPASFDLGHHVNVTLLSVTEGDDKPAKYPVMFRASDLLILSKIDLLPLLDDFDPHKAEACLRQLANDAPVISLSASKAQRLALWTQWLEQTLQRHRHGLQAGKQTLPKLPSGAGPLLHHHEQQHHSHA